MAKKIMDAGGLVGDEIMIGLVRERLQAPDAATRGYILDGFPRTIDQADASTASSPTSGSTSCSTSTCRARSCSSGLSSRRVCQDCGTNYTASGTDPDPWICDVCGGDVKQRGDDTPESVNRRLDLYEEQTFPLIKHYGDQNRLVVVNGIGHPDSVFDRLVKAVESTRP